MLESFVMKHSGAITPMGNTVFALDTDFSWKKRQFTLNSKPSSNAYNLVHLTPDKKKKFEIAGAPLSKQTFVCDRIKSSTHRPKQLHESQCHHTPLEPPTSSDQDFTKEDVKPQYVNVCDSRRQEHKPIFPTERCKDNEEFDGYENWPAI